ncbi:hypothetical protein HNQ93_004413 [Hymenobacter luteus]|uniref:Uncharacterized protein n=2 Tax=Hymenobacter TaxID=89966 RepID=A0A7W9T4P0_9BACT|nr:hypothetical protein [Hymenobacter latericoloratus]MBB6061532.1 hypothetical protein [Hymenobacter luteus]
MRQFFLCTALLCLFPLLGTRALGQSVQWNLNEKSSVADTLYTTRGANDAPTAGPVIRLRRYQTSPCLDNLLAQLVKNDKNCRQDIGYLFSSCLISGRPLVNIYPVDLKRVRAGRFCTGYFRYSNRIFLCLDESPALLSQVQQPEPLVLTPYVTTEMLHNDFYLGGDNDGAVYSIRCGNQQQYARVKPCTPPGRKGKLAKMKMEKVAP